MVTVDEAVAAQGDADERAAGGSQPSDPWAPTVKLTDPQRRALEVLAQRKWCWANTVADALWPEQYKTGRKAGFRAGRAAQLLHRLVRMGLADSERVLYSYRWWITDEGREALKRSVQ